jgi:hypothetical protein
LPLTITAAWPFSTQCAGLAGSAVMMAVRSIEADEPPLSAPLPLWVQALEQALTRGSPVPEFSRSWQTVAAEHLALYRAMLSSHSDPDLAPL